MEGKKRNDGGPAFARAGSEHNYDAEGMSLRDYYAGLAMQAIIRPDIKESRDDIADWAYDMADAMIRRRG